ncbi:MULTISPECIES: urea carboxylase-associated family protein [unclassified Mesorhizobium]|nr:MULTISPECIES: urea carboxylase-associated family protein [unclassified Mesorhizobium]
MTDAKHYLVPAQSGLVVTAKRGDRIRITDPNRRAGIIAASGQA